MAVAQGLLFVALLLFGVHCSSPLPACPDSCTCQRAPLLNCSSSGLSLVPQHIQDSVTELDLSHNLLNSVTLLQPHRNLRNVWLGNNTITHLSLCIERNLGSQHVRDRHLRRSRPWIRRGCVSWAPTLQLLSVERNQLQQLPEGLQGSEFLQVLQLSFNRISTLQPGDLRYLQQLKELHLQHNLITSLHPQMFQDLAQLRVLDLRFNMLTSLHPLLYLSLRNIGADVRLDGNRWHCDCIMRSVRRQMAYENSRALQTWSILCSSPSDFSGKDLLQLEEDDLNCLSTANMPVLHRDVTVYSGSEILLSCSTQESVWWTPTGQASVSQPQTDLFISDVTERDVGLYVCVSEDYKVKSIFNLQISKIGGTKRNARSLSNSHKQIIPQDTPNSRAQERNSRQSELTLAICLSVFITFLIAFILGVLARPCIDVLWKRVTKKKRSSATNSASPVERRQYENEGFSSGEEPEIPTHRERRVTFSTVDFREDINVQYYDTVVGGSQESINDEAVIVCEVTVENEHSTGDSGSEKTLRQKNGKITDEGCTHNKEFEHIPDSVELEERRSRSSSSSSSDSSLSDTVIKEDRTQPKSSQLAKDSVQQRPDLLTATKVEVPQISIEGTSEVLGFPSEPFAEWSPHTNNNISTDLDLLQENEEQFEFSDSARSTSARSSIVFGSFNDVAPSSHNQKRDDMSSSSSYVSENEPTHYTVNSDTEEEENIERNQTNGDNRYNTQRPPLRPEHSLSSDSSGSEDELVHCIVKKETDKKEGKEKYISDYDKPNSRIVTAKRDSKDKAPSLSSSSSSSSDSENETFCTDKSRKMVIAGLPLQESPTDSLKQFPVVDLEHIPQIQRRLDIKAQSLDSDSSSSSDSENVTTYCTDRPGKVDIAELPLQKSESHDAHARWPVLDLHLKPPSDSDSSSSSDSENEMGHMEKQRPGKVDIAGLQFQPLFPVLDLEHIPRIERRLDFKAPSPAPDKSSSSDSEDETAGHTDNLRPGKVDIQYQVSQAVTHDPDKYWPAIDLEHIPHIKKRFDIKAPSPPSDLSFNNEIVEVKIPEIKKQEQGKTHMAKLPLEISQTVTHEPETRWPALDLEHTTHIKRRLDIKVPSLATDSSSSSDSENEAINQIKKQEQGKTHMAKLPLEISHEPEKRWPALDLDHTTRVKRRLDIKAPSSPSDSSTSSDSEDESIDLTEKQRPAKPDLAELPLYDPDTRWPAVDFEHLPRIKRRLDIKAPLPTSDSSSSSNSEDETTNCIKKQEQGETHIAKLPVEISQTVTHEPETRWPALDLDHTTRVKRRLDIKAPSPPSDSSPSSDSEDEIIDLTGKQRPAKPNIAELPLNDPDTRWPAVDFEHLPRIKRRLNIKAPLPTSDSSSSSDSEDKTTNCIKKQEQGETHIAKLPVEISQTVTHEPENQWPALDLEHTTRIKRRLDIKAPSSPSDSSTSSDSEDEVIDQTEKQRPAKPDLALNDPDATWPALDLNHIPHIKRRLDIKSPPPESPSSSEIVEEKLAQVNKHNQETVHMTKFPFQKSEAEDSLDPEKKWPVLELMHPISIKRRLDIKPPSQYSDSSFSSDSKDKTTYHTQKPENMNIVELSLQKSQTSQSHDQDTQWPTVDLGNITRIKRRLDIKAPSPPTDSLLIGASMGHTVKGKRNDGNKIGPYYSPSSSDEEDDNLGKKSQKLMSDPDPRWPELDLSSANRVKMRLDIKACNPSLGASSSSESDSGTTNLKVDEDRRHHKDVGITKNEQQTLDKLKLGIPHINRRLDIQVTSPHPDLGPTSVSVGSQQSSSSSSSSESEDEKTNLKAKVGIGVSAVSKASKKESITSSETPLADQYIKLEKYTVISDNASSISTNDNKTPEINPELQLRWATMNLGISRFRKRLEITSRTSPSSFSSENEGKRWKATSQLPVVTDKEASQNHTSQSEMRKDRVVESDSMWPQLSLTKIPTVKRALDIRGPLETESSSSSNSEDETLHHSIPNLSLGVPRIKRRLNIKAPSPEQSDSPSSCSEGENEAKRYTTKETKNVSGKTDNESIITYKRLIMKAPSLPSNSLSPSDDSQTTRYVEMVTDAQDGPSHGVRDRIKSLSPRRVLSASLGDVVKKKTDHSRSTTDVDFPPEIRWTGISRHLSDLSVSSSRRHLDVDLSPPQQAPAFITFDNSTGSTNEILRDLSDKRTEKKGLSALKIMSSERQKWDTDNDVLHRASPISDNHGPNNNHHRSEEEIKFLAKRPLTQFHLPSTSLDERKAADLLYGIPQYRGHDTGDTDPPQEPPPPVPATPPPDEAVELTWRPPQRSKITRNMDFDSSKISVSDV